MCVCVCVCVSCELVCLHKPIESRHTQHTHTLVYTGRVVVLFIMYKFIMSSLLCISYEEKDKKLKRGELPCNFFGPDMLMM